MSNAFRRVADAVQSILGLIWIGIGQRGRIRSSYWRWREQTAFGQPDQHEVCPRQRRRALMAFGRWSWRMRRG